MYKSDTKDNNVLLSVENLDELIQKDLEEVLKQYDNDNKNDDETNKKDK